MKENEESKGRQGRVSTCFEGSPCAEMMQKLMEEQDMGLFGEEVMKMRIKRGRAAEEVPQATSDGLIRSHGGVK